MLFGITDISSALDICALHPDGQFKYACASGIYMTLSSEFDNETLEPCKSSKFPSTCFRFGGKMFSKRDRETICSGYEMDPYHELGCIFGEAYNSFAATKSFKTCDIYVPKSKTKEPGNTFYAGCVDGLLSLVALSRTEEEATEFCRRYRHSQKGYETCMQRSTMDPEALSLDEDEFYYNYELLETFNNE